MITEWDLNVIGSEGYEDMEDNLQVVVLEETSTRVYVHQLAIIIPALVV